KSSSVRSVELPPHSIERGQVAVDEVRSLVPFNIAAKSQNERRVAAEKQGHRRLRLCRGCPKNGVVDVIRLYNRDCLSGSDLTAIYNEGQSGLPGSSINRISL